MVNFSLHSCLNRLRVDDSDGHEPLPSLFDAVGVESLTRKKSFGSGVLSRTVYLSSKTFRNLYRFTIGLEILLAFGHSSFARLATLRQTPLGGILPGTVLNGVTVGSPRYIW